MRLGDRVEVRTRFDGSWARGFRIAEVRRSDEEPMRIALRRESDGVILPTLFAGPDVRPADSESRR